MATSFWVLMVLILIALGAFYVYRAIRPDPAPRIADSKKITDDGELPIIARQNRENPSNAQINVSPDLHSKVHITTHTADVNPHTASAVKAASKATAPDEQDALADLARATEPFTEKHAPRALSQFDVPAPRVDAQILAAGKDQAAASVLDSFTAMVQIDLLPTDNRVILGADVLDAAHMLGLKHGYNDLFHRYQEEDGTGPLWFSMMGGVLGDQPAPFDLAGMPNARYSSLCLFLALPNAAAPLAVSAMIETAEKLAESLGADATYCGRPLKNCHHSIRAATVH